jgi:hypothetical protein
MMGSNSSGYARRRKSHSKGDDELIAAGLVFLNLEKALNQNIRLYPFRAATR